MSMRIIKGKVNLKIRGKVIIEMRDKVKMKKEAEKIM